MSVHGSYYRRRRQPPPPPPTPFPTGSDGDILYREVKPSIEAGSFQSLEEVRNYVDAVASANPDARHYTALEAVLDVLGQEGLPESVVEPSEEEEWTFAGAVARPGGLPQVLKELDGLNKTAAKRLKAESRLHLFVAPESRMEIHPNWYKIDPLGLRPVPDSFKILVYGFEILGEPLKVPGWTLIGVITYLDDGSAALTKAPGYEGKIPKRFYESTPDHCDHCGFCRRRKETFILWNGKRKYIQVGRNCLKDFLGVTGTELERRFDLLRVLGVMFGGRDDEGDAGGFARAGGPDVPYLVAWGAAVYRKSGWRTAKQVLDEGMGVASAEEAVRWARTDPQGLRGKTRVEYERLQPEREDLENADKAIKWITVLAVDPMKDDYLFKLQQLTRQEFVPDRMMKITAGLYAAYKRAMEQKSRVRVSSQHVGEVGERGTFPGLKLEFKRSFPSRFQAEPVNQHKFVDRDGNVFVWWASSDPGTEVGETYDVVATIKKHDSFRGENQTVLSRAVIHKPGEAPTRGRQKAGYVGTEGERDLFSSVTLESSFTVETSYGDLDILKFRDPNNNVLVWKTSSRVRHPVSGNDIKEGDTVDLVATVKEHSEFRGEKQTVVQRASMFAAGKGKPPRKKKGGTTSGPKSKMGVVQMRPSDFLRLTSTPRSGLNEHWIGQIDLDSPDNWPLWLLLSGGGGAEGDQVSVVMHDGRHRAAAAMDAGLGLVPVALYSSVDEPPSVEFEEVVAEGGVLKLWSQYYDDEEIAEGFLPERLMEVEIAAGDGPITTSGPRKRLPWILQGLAAEARKAPSFEDFDRDYQFQIKHGLYWHWTDDPEFEIDPEKGPRDMSSMGSPGMSRGQLMITSHLENWADYGNRRYAAVIDMRDVPREAYYQVQRGFGNEFIVFDPSRARVKKVYRRDAAFRFDRDQHKYLPRSQEELEEFYDWAVSEGGTTISGYEDEDDFPEVEGRAPGIYLIRPRSWWWEQMNRDSQQGPWSC